MVIPLLPKNRSISSTIVLVVVNENLCLLVLLRWAAMAQYNNIFFCISLLSELSRGINSSIFPTG